MASTHTPTSSTVTLPIALVGAGSFTVYGWVYIPDVGSSHGLMNCVGGAHNLEIYYDTDWSRWLVSYAGTGQIGVAWYPDVGWMWVALVYNASTLTIYWRREGHYNLSYMTCNWTDGGNFSSIILSYGSNCHADYQYWGSYVGTLTPTQLLAQSYSSTQIVAGRSFWSLTDNVGTDTVGAYNATLSNTTIASREASVGGPFTPATNITSEFDRHSTATTGDFAVTTESPFATSQTFTISLWAEINWGENAYLVNFVEPGGEALLFVGQYDSYNGPNHYMSNLMSSAAGDWGTHAADVTPAEAEGWVFLAWVITSTGSTKSCAHYSSFGSAGLQSRALGIPSVTEPNWNSNQMVRVGASQGSVNFRAQHLRIHTSALTEQQISALVFSGDNDTTAWGHWPLIAGQLQDVSGNGRHLLLAREGDIFPSYLGGPPISFTVANIRNRYSLVTSGDTVYPVRRISNS